MHLQMPSHSVRALPFPALCDDMLNMLVCATRWLSLHLYMLSYMSMHESCFLVCRPCFSTMKLWTFDLNLHLSLVDTTFVCFLACLPFSLCVCFLTCYACHVYHVYLLHAPFICSLHIFLPLLVCRFLVFAFTCMHMEQGCLELGHELPDISKKGADTSIWI